MTKLQKRRQKLGLSTWEVATLWAANIKGLPGKAEPILNVMQNDYQALEGGHERQYTIKVWQALARALDCKMEDLA